MKTVNIESADLDVCVKDAQQERVVLTRNGVPVALIVGIEGLDEEQLQLGSSDKFWNWIKARRNQPAIDRTELERQVERLKPGKR